MVAMVANQGYFLSYSQRLWLTNVDSLNRPSSNYRSRLYEHDLWTCHTVRHYIYLTSPHKAGKVRARDSMRFFLKHMTDSLTHHMTYKIPFYVAFDKSSCMNLRDAL